MKPIQDNHNLELLNQIFFNGKKILTNSEENKLGTKYYCIKNPDGLIRWMIPMNTKQPLYLNFYYASSIKATIYLLVSKILWAVKLYKLLFDGYVVIPDHTENRIQIIKQNELPDEYSLFTGTNGPGRKAIILIEKNKQQKFIKIGLSEFSIKRLKKEIKILDHVSSIEPVNFIIPTVSLDPERKYYIQSQPPGNAIQCDTLENVHFKFIENLYTKTHSTTTFISMKCISKSDKINSEIQQLANNNELKSLSYKLKILRTTFNEQQLVQTSFAHCDFTPWNTKLLNQKLYVYDWEMGQTQIPLLYDIFLFEIQKEIMVLHKKTLDVDSFLNQISSFREIQEIQLQYGIKPSMYFNIFVYIHLSTYLKVYQLQKEWHPQVQWQLNFWNNILQQLLPEKNETNCKISFIKSLFDKLKEKEYCVMKYTGWNIESFPENSDIDLLIQEQDRSSIIQEIKKYPLIKKLNIINLNHLTILNIYFADGDFLEIDLITEFKRKSFVYLHPAKILQSSGCTEEGIKVAQAHFDYEYIVTFYQLNNSDVPDRYINQFYQYHSGKQYQIRCYLKHRFHLFEDDQLFKFHPHSKQNIINECMILNQQLFFSKIIRIGHYLQYIISRLINYKGFIITISGVDGAGKSTIIENIKKKLEEKMRRNVVVLRHRPGLFPILSSYVHGKSTAELIAASQGPHAGKNKNIFSSLLRYTYYLVDYLIGQPYVWVKHIAKGNIVIYDRYYYDFITDPKRSNLHLPAAFTKKFLFLIAPPRINILLYAPTEEIRKRKKELSEEEIESITLRYLKLFNELADKHGENKFSSILNLNQKETIEKIIHLYVQAA